MTEKEKQFLVDLFETWLEDTDFSETEMELVEYYGINREHAKQFGAFCAGYLSEER